MTRPVELATRARIIELIQSGMGRNAIAREVKVAPSSVSVIATEEELSFDRGPTASAVAARQMDMKALRVDLVNELMMKANDHLVAIDQPYDVFAFGGQFNDYEEKERDQPPIADRLSLHRAASLALKDARDLLHDDDDEGVGEAESLLMNLILELGLNDDE